MNLTITEIVRYRADGVMQYVYYNNFVPKYNSLRRLCGEL